MFLNAVLRFPWVSEKLTYRVLFLEDLKCTPMFVCLVGFLTSSSTTRLYRRRAPRQSVWQFYVLSHMRQSFETVTSVSAGHIILTSPTQPVGSGRPQWQSNPGPPHQELRALPTDLSRPPMSDRNILIYCNNMVWNRFDFLWFGILCAVICVTGITPVRIMNCKQDFNVSLIFRVLVCMLNHSNCERWFSWCEWFDIILWLY